MTIRDYLEDEKTTEEREKLNKVYASIANNVKFRLYRYRDFAIFHVTVPSSKPGDVSYDVVIEVKTSALHASAATIEDLPIRVFSNCPSFVFGHAYRYNQKKVFIDWLADKYDASTLEKDPDEAKSSKYSYLERSVYLALLYIHNTGLTGRTQFKSIGNPVSSTKRIANTIRTHAEIMNNVRDRIASQKEEIRAKSRLEKAEEEKKEATIKLSRRAGDKVPVVSTMKSTKVTSRTKSGLKSKVVKHTKKI